MRLRHADRPRARGSGRLPDHIRPGLRVLFVGINPGIRSAAVGHHFAGHSNRFWKLLHESGLVSRPIGWQDDHRLLEWGYGITNLVPRPTSGIDELRSAEYRMGRRALYAKIRRYRPRVVALVGITIHRALFPAAGATGRRIPPGLSSETIHGAQVFVLPNPSGRNASLTYEEMRAAFQSLRRFL